MPEGTNELTILVACLYPWNRSDRLLRKYFEVTQIWDRAYSDKLTDFTTSRIRETLTYSHANPQGISWPLTISKH